MKPFPILCLLLACTTMLAPAAPPNAEARWKAVLAKVHPGMRRAAVEKLLGSVDSILDFDPGPTGSTKTERKGRTALYLFDEQWCATITYDSTGFRSRNNPYLVIGLPDNKVASPPRLLARTPALNAEIERQTDH